MISKTTVGIDEAGRGSWAGPLVAAAVCVEEGWHKKDVTDSKALIRRRRQECLRYIQTTVLHIGIGWVAPAHIDGVGLQTATSLAMMSALKQIPDYPLTEKIIIDGHINYLPDVGATTPLIKADQTVPAVAAASIVAKCYRDNYMINIAGRYAGYGFESHVGYGTALHRAGLERYGICELHRVSFAPVRTVAVGGE